MGHKASKALAYVAVLLNSFFTARRQTMAIPPTTSNSIGSRHTEVHPETTISLKAIIIPLAISITLQKTPNFHTKLTLFLSPHAQNSPKMPNQISSQNGLSTKKCMATLLLSSKLSQVKDEPVLSIVISNAISDIERKLHKLIKSQ